MITSDHERSVCDCGEQALHITLLPGLYMHGKIMRNQRYLNTDIYVKFAAICGICKYRL